MNVKSHGAGQSQCSFLSHAADLKGAQRTAENVLAALRRDQKISTWDMSENYKWLPALVRELEAAGRIVEVTSEFPWHRYEIKEDKAND